MDQCAKHGAYHCSVTKDGIERWLPGCPACAKERELEAVLGRAAIPPRFRDRGFLTFDAQSPAQRRALEMSEAYAEGFKSMFLPRGISMIFVGRPGTGKTHLACAILNNLVPQGHYGLYVTVIDAVRRVKDTWSKSSGELERDAIRRFVKPELLVLDEVGVQFGTEAEKLILFEIINGRYEMVRPTIIVSNLDMKGVEDNLGYRVVDRLCENGGQKVVFDWDSWRRS